MGEQQVPREVVGYRPLTRLRTDLLTGPASVVIKKVLEQYPDGWFPEPNHFPTRREARAALVARGVAKEDIKLRKVTRRAWNHWQVSILVGYSDGALPQWKRIGIPGIAGQGLSWNLMLERQPHQTRAAAREGLRVFCKNIGLPPRLVLGCRLRWHREFSFRIQTSHRDQLFCIERFADYPRKHLSELVASFDEGGESVTVSVRRRSGQTPADLVGLLQDTLRKKHPAWMWGDDVLVRAGYRTKGVPSTFRLKRIWRPGPPPSSTSEACEKRKAFATYKQATGAAHKMRILYKKSFIVQPCPECGLFHLAMHRGKRESGRAYPKVTA